MGEFVKGQTTKGDWQGHAKGRDRSVVLTGPRAGNMIVCNSCNNSSCSGSSSNNSIIHETKLFLITVSYMKCCNTSYSPLRKDLNHFRMFPEVGTVDSQTSPLTVTAQPPPGGGGWRRPHGRHSSLLLASRHARHPGTQSASHSRTHVLRCCVAYAFHKSLLCTFHIQFYSPDSPTPLPPPPSVASRQWSSIRRRSTPPCGTPQTSGSSSCWLDDDQDINT